MNVNLVYLVYHPDTFRSLLTLSCRYTQWRKEEAYHALFYQNNMWRGYFKGGDQAWFDRMANQPSTFGSSSQAGSLGIVDRENQPMFGTVLDDLVDPAFCDRILKMSDEAGFHTVAVNHGDGRQEKGVVMKEVRSGGTCNIGSGPDSMDNIEIASLLFEAIKQHLPSPSIVPGKRYQSKDGSNDWVPVCVNPNLRVLRYGENDKFECHQDGGYFYETLKSYITLQLYLNNGGGEDFTGGGTRFFQEQQKIKTHVSAASSRKVKARKRKNTNNSKGREDKKDSETATNEESAPVPRRTDQGDSTTEENENEKIEEFRVVEVVPRKGRIILFQQNIWHEGECVTNGSKLVLRTEVMFAQRSLKEFRDQSSAAAVLQASEVSTVT